MFFKHLFILSCHFLRIWVIFCLPSILRFKVTFGRILRRYIKPVRDGVEGRRDISLNGAAPRRRAGFHRTTRLAQTLK
jgi:hypothetical protein